MNRMTLAFNSFDIEQQYQEVMTKQTKEFQHSQKWIFLTLGIFYIALKAVEQDWIGFGLSTGSCVFIILIFTQKLINNWERIYDICLIIVILGYNLYYPIMNYFQNFTSDNLYVEAYFVSLGTLGTTSMFGFKTKSIVITLISVSLICLAISSETIFWKQIVKGVIFLSLYLQNGYCFEKFRKTLFLEYLRRKTILKGIHDFTNISTYVVHYITDKIVLVQKDDQRYIGEQDKNDFDDYLQNMRISHSKAQSKYTSILTLDHFNKEKTISLKQLLYGVFSSDQNKSSKLNDDELAGLNQFVGQAVYEQEYYSLYLIKEFDINPCIIIVLQEKQKEVQLEEISLKNKMLRKSLDQTALIFDKQIKIALIYFKWIYNNQDKAQNIFLINRCLQSIRGKMVKAYNDFQNIIDFHTINQEFQNSIIKKFDIQACLQEQTKIISHLDVNKEVNFTIVNNLEKNSIQQDEKQVKQLLYNLLFFTSNSSQSITITLQQELHGIHKKELIKIRIDYQGPNLTGQQLQGLQIINPQNLGELLHNSQKPFELELPLSLMIIRKIGPYNKMRLQQNKSKQNFMEFYLFRHLEESYHLIPAYSLHPLNSLILKEKNNFDTKILTTYYEKMQISPRINVSNFHQF